MTIEKQIEQQHYARVPLAVTVSEIQRGYDSFEGLVSLPLDVRKAGDYALMGATNGQFGYFRRYAGSDSGGRATATETKHEYHFGSNTRQAFETSTASWVRLPSEVREFCEAAEPIYWNCVSTITDTLARMHAELPFGKQRITTPMYTEFFDPLLPLNIHLRFGAYEQTSETDEFLAHGHFDRSVLTLGVAQSEPGLEIGAQADGSDLQPADFVPGTAQFFAGKGWENMPTEFVDSYSYMHPAYHWVRNTGNYTVSPAGIVRRMMVCFVNSLRTATDAAIMETRPERAMCQALNA